MSILRTIKKSVTGALKQYTGYTGKTAAQAARMRGRRSPSKTSVRWNQAQRGNAHVSDGIEGFWAEFPAGTTAREVLDQYMATADYDGATATFTVRAEIAGETASCEVEPVLVPSPDDARRGRARSRRGAVMSPSKTETMRTLFRARGRQAAEADAVEVAAGRAAGVRGHAETRSMLEHWLLQDRKTEAELLAMSKTERHHAYQAAWDGYQSLAKEYAGPRSSSPAKRAVQAYAGYWVNRDYVGAKADSPPLPRVNPPLSYPPRERHAPECTCHVCFEDQMEAEAKAKARAGTSVKASSAMYTQSDRQTRRHHLWEMVKRHGASSKAAYTAVERGKSQRERDDLERARKALAQREGST